MKPRVALLQIEDRHDTVLDSFMDHNKKYCKRHDIHYVRLEKPYGDVLCPYWRKIFVLRDLLDTNRFDSILWMDSDAYVFDTDKDVREFIYDYPNKSMIISPDPPFGLWISKFMAGVFLVNNTDMSKKIVSEWCSIYDPTAWAKENGKWVCQKICLYANSIYYEQGAFVKNIMTNPLYASAIHTVPSKVFHEIECPPRDGCFSVHLPKALGLTVRKVCFKESGIYRTWLNLTIKWTCLPLCILFLCIYIIIITSNLLFPGKNAT